MLPDYDDASTIYYGPSKDPTTSDIPFPHEKAHTFRPLKPSVKVVVNMTPSYWQG